MVPSGEARSVLVYLIPFVAVIAAVSNAVIGRNGKWDKAYQFSLHPYAEGMASNAQFTGPFMSKVHVLPSARAALQDESPGKHLQCNRDMFPDQKHFDKCKMMRSAPMFLGNVTHSWSVLGAQSTSTLTKHMFLTFIVFTFFWCFEYALTEQMIRKESAVYFRNTVVFAAVLVFVFALAFDVKSDSTAVATGSVSTAFYFVVLCLLIVCCEYAGMNGKLFVLGTQADVEQNTVKISTPNKEHMHRNIYLSYASLLTFPLVVVFILSHTHAAIVDVHIQLVFFSFIFYATLDVFQTRTTAVLLSLQDPAPAPAPAETADATAQPAPDALPAACSKNLAFVKIFVVLAFVLCKCFALVPALVLLQKQYNERMFQQATLAVHYVVLGGFALADLAHITLPEREMHPDLLKLVAMLFYTGFIFFGTCWVDT